MSFSQLGLSQELLQAVTEQGYQTPTPIQQQAIPAILDGRDIVAEAQTGTGKTAGFTLPLLQLLSSEKSPPFVIRALILTPTRELTAQVFDSLQSYGQFLPLTSFAIFGGVSINPQIKQLQRGVDIVVATPGRLIDLIRQKKIDLSQVQLFVLDEADRMLDMGFLPDIKTILASLPKQRQNLLFSATFSKEVKKVATVLLNDPLAISVNKQNSTAKTVKHILYPVTKDRKRELLSYLIGFQNWPQVLIFTRTKHGADRLSKQLQKDGIRSTAIHGNKSQHARNKALDFFKSGSVSALVATDIAARGLDIEQLPFVVNFDLPAVAEDYVHRVGRTGRAGFHGTAISLVCQEDIKQLLAIERLLQHKIKEVQEPGFETRLQRNIKNEGSSEKKPLKKTKPEHTPYKKTATKKKSLRRGNSNTNNRSEQDSRKKIYRKKRQP